jgi:hypothetical protein
MNEYKGKISPGTLDKTSLLPGEGCIQVKPSRRHFRTGEDEWGSHARTLGVRRPRVSKSFNDPQSERPNLLKRLI